MGSTDTNTSPLYGLQVSRPKSAVVTVLDTVVVIVVVCVAENDVDAVDDTVDVWVEMSQLKKSPFP